MTLENFRPQSIEGCAGSKTLHVSVYNHVSTLVANMASHGYWTSFIFITFIWLVSGSQGKDQDAGGAILDIPNPASLNLMSSSMSSSLLTSTAPWCRERKSVHKSSKSTLLSVTDLSRVLEMCMGMKEKPLSFMVSNMKVLSSGSATKPAVASLKHAQNEKSHVSLIQAMTVTSGQQQHCLGPWPHLQRNVLYNLANSTTGTTLYLLTGENKERNAVTGERIIINSSLGQPITVFLGTSNLWRISGNNAATIQTGGDHEISICVQEFNVTLVRFVSKWTIIYRLKLHMPKTSHLTYGGLLGDMLTRNHPATSAEPNCLPLSKQQSLMTSYQYSPFIFAHFFLDLMHDLSKNFPSNTFNLTQA